MTEKNPKYGFKEPIIDKSHYFLGAGNVPQVVLQEDGQWDNYLPENELQNLYGVEPYACASFGSLNAVEILIKRVLGEQKNFSDRFLAKNSGTAVGGNDPHTVLESLRKEGTPLQEKWDITPDVNTFEKFYEKLPAPLFAEARKDFLEPYIFKHEWVFDFNQPLDEKQRNIMTSLRYSPLGVSVYAWSKDENGLYFKAGNDNHWVCCYGYEKGKYWKIFDSYDSTHKKLEWNFNFGYCKRFHIEKQTAPLKKSWWIIDLFRSFFSTFFRKPLGGTIDNSVLSLYASQPSMRPFLESQFPSVVFAASWRLAEYAKACHGKDKAKTQNETGCAEAVNTVVQECLNAPIGGGTSTNLMYRELRNNPKRFVKVEKPCIGAIVMSPTGYGNGTIPHGHVGICVDGNVIYANDSKSGLWLPTYTVDSWTKRYAQTGGFPVYYYMVLF